MKKNKLFSLILAGLMCLGAFTACGTSESPSAAASDSGSGSTGTSTGTSTSAAGEAAAADEPTANILWFIRCDEPKNYDSVMQAVNEKIKSDINMTLDLRFIAQGDYDTKMQMAMAGGDDWDLCFTSHWANSYVNAAGKGAYLELDDLLATNAPNMMGIIPAQFWDGVRVNGNIYGMINYQVMYEQSGWMFNKQVVEETGMDVSGINTIQDLTGALEQIKQAYPDKYATGSAYVQMDYMFHKPPLSLVLSLPFLTYDPDTQKISNDLFFEKNSDMIDAMKIWKDQGYMPPDAATLKDEVTLIRQEQILSRYTRIKPGVEASLENLYNAEMVAVELGESIINTGAVQSTLTAVNVNSKQPEKAIQLYDYIFSNKEAANILFYGVEGQDYEVVNGDRVKVLEDAWYAYAWQLGNQFNAYLLEADEAGVWEATMKGNAEALLDPLFGFSPDRTPVETEIATCEAIWAEYKDILYYGLQDKETAIPEMMDKLQKAGLEKITTEMQSQVDSFLAATK